MPKAVVGLRSPPWAFVILGWALAQRPELLPGLTVDDKLGPILMRIELTRHPGAGGPRLLRRGAGAFEAETSGDLLAAQTQISCA